MPMPSNSKIEDRALDALRNIIDDHATMGHEFHSMDKEMSWDGYIWIYKDINGTQDKRNYDDKVPVQIKGHVDKNRKYIDEQKITYFVDLDDLEVYFQDRGVLFFEVFMTEDGKDREIFYASLFPTKLKYYLEKAECKGNKKTIHVAFAKMETSPDAFYAIVKQFSNESKKQGFGHEQMVQNAIKYGDFSRVTSITASAVGVNNDIEFMKRIGDGDVSFYGTIEGSPIKVPLEWHEEVLHFLWKEINRGVYVNDKKYYEKYRIQISSEEEITFIPSDNLSINMKESKLKFYPQTGIRTIRNDAEFLLDVMKYSGFKTADTTFPCKDIENENRFKEKLQFFIDLDDTLSMIEFSYNKPFKEISEETVRAFAQLIAVRKGQRNSSFTENVHIFNWKVDDKYVPVVVFVNRDGGENNIYNAIYTKQCASSVCDCNGNYFVVPLHSGVDAHVLANLYEYKYEYFYEQIDAAVINEETSETLNCSALKLIQVYDENKDAEMLKIALYTLKKLKDTLGENENYLINELQIKCRQGQLDESEKAALEAIEGDDLQLLCAKNILLENRTEAVKYYGMLSKDAKDFFSEWPIYRLYQKLVAEGKA